MVGGFVVEMASILIAANSFEGHRREYISLFKRIITSAGAEVEVRSLRWTDASRKPVIFSLMLEENTSKFFLIALARAVAGRRSVALMFRPGEAIEARSLKHWIKRAGLKLLLRFRSVHILTILPFALRPEFKGIARDWIYDPQLWDLSEHKEASSTEMSRELRTQANGRRLLVALGAQNSGKGFDYLAEIWAANPQLRERFHFAACGKVAAGSAKAAASFIAHGGQLVDRFLEDDEVLSAYACADVVWSCYSPEYDQASGIFGRAVQTGVPAVVREGAYLVPLAETLDHPVIVVPWADNHEAACRLTEAPLQPIVRGDLVSEAKGESLRRLGDALGIELTAST